MKNELYKLADKLEKKSQELSAHEKDTQNQVGKAINAATEETARFFNVTKSDIRLSWVYVFGNVNCEISLSKFVQDKIAQQVEEMRKSNPNFGIVNYFRQAVKSHLTNKPALNYQIYLNKPF